LVLGVAGSPRARSNSRLLLEHVLAGAVAAGAEIELISLRDLRMGSCLHCGGCDRTGDCVVADDILRVHARLKQAQHLVLASPIQFAGVSANAKAMIDRAQAFWVATYILKKAVSDAPGERRGLFIATCGGGDLRVFEYAKPTAKSFFNSCQFKYWGELFESNTDVPPPVSERAELLARAEHLGRELVCE
jgi:NAD(P)H-dependent FMN reductase